MYYKSIGLINQAFQNTRHAWWFPFFGTDKFVPRTGGKAITVPRQHWVMLPTASRLILFGARPEWRDGRLLITYGHLRFVAPSTDKTVAISLKEVFKDDVYKLKNKNLTDKVVLDVGANVGDSSIAYALRGAKVHAFEPLPILHNYLKENIALNNLQDAIKFHPVGLSTKDEVVQVPIGLYGTSGATVLPLEEDKTSKEEHIIQDLRLVNAVSYLKAEGITKIDLLKLDCEGCEYALLSNNDFLDSFMPDSIVMEYHRGGEDLYRFLTGKGYAVDWPDPGNRVGYMYCVRTI